MHEKEGSENINEDILIKRELTKVIFNIKDSLLCDINSLTIDEKKKLLNSFITLDKNTKSNINLTCSLLSLPLHTINDNDINSINTKKFISDINTAFTNYLSSTLNS